MSRARKTRGTSLVEILIAVVFLAVCASAILDAVWTGNLQASYAMRRTRVMGLLQDQLESLRGYAASGSLATATASASTTPPGFVGPVSISGTIHLETNSLTLYDVTVTATWTEEGSFGTRTDTASLSTVIKN